MVDGTIVQPVAFNPVAYKKYVVRLFSCKLEATDAGITA